jgi:hypothetical protein
MRKQRVPILTVHTREHIDPETKKSWTSKLDADQLAVLYRNTVARRLKGEVPQLFVGHTVRGAPETAQPPGVGYVDNFTLGIHEGKPAMLADLFIKKEADLVELGVRPAAYIVDEFARSSAEV